MRPLYFAFIAFALSACAPEKDRPAPVTAAPLISEIPKGCVGVEQTNLFGAHEFGPGQVHMSIALDCGTREGKRCWYYVQANALTGIAPLEDVRCE